MSRESARVRAVQQAERLRHLLQSCDRIELMGYAITKAPAPGEVSGNEPPNHRDDVLDFAPDRIAARRAAGRLPDG